MPSTSNLVQLATTLLVVSAAMGIPENIKALRKREGLSQPELAKKAKVSQQLLSQLENGKNLTTKKLPQIARALNATVEEIDPNFRGVSGSGQRDELTQIYDRLGEADRADFQAHLLDQARRLEALSRPAASLPKKKAGDAR